MSTILYVFLALLVLGVCIFVHEFGHYLAARACGLTVVEFAVGMGPAIVKWRRKDIDYSIRALPIGGYCSFIGEEAEDEAEDPRNINLQPAWKRLVMTVSGPLMNGLLALVMSVVLMSAIGKYVPVNRIATVEDGMPAQTAGIQVGDEIIGVDGVMCETMDALTAAVSATGDKDVELTLLREGETLTLTVSKAYDAETARYMMGVTFANEHVRMGFFEAVGNSFSYCAQLLKVMVQTLGQLFTNEEVMNSVTGPVGTVSLVAEMSQTSFEQSFRQGMTMVINLLVIISMNLGLMNLLPLPALDGGRAVLLVWETITGKHLSRKAEAVVHFAGLILLLGLIVLITGRDILRLFGVNV